MAAASLPILLGCGGDGDPRPAPGAADPGGGAFVDVAAAAGITHRHHRPYLDPQLDNIMPWMASVGAAAAAGDYDNDGWIDLFVTDSLKGEPNRLYRNRGDGSFAEAGAAAGLADHNDDKGVSMDAVWGDYDNDGWADLYLVRWGRDLLFRNRGDGTFADATETCLRRPDGSPGSPWENGNAAVWLDYDRDGRLDLYVGNYFQGHDLWHLTTTRILHDSFERARNGAANQLLHQGPDGTFTDVAAAAGVADTGWTLAVGAADVNNDGWPDLYAANDFGPDQLFLNRGDGTFENLSDHALGYDTKKGMNADFGDVDNDGWLDIYVANITTAEYLQEGNMLWRNNGPGADGRVTFTDVALEAGAHDGGWGWGAKLFDYDNDGDLDVAAVNGFISAGEGSYWYDLASWTVTGAESADAKNWPTIGDRSFSGYEKTRFWVNDGLATFTERARQLGVDSDRDGRGLLYFDYDNDGDLDLFVANQNQAPHLYRNPGTPGRHWLGVSLVADPTTGTNRDAVGARVTLLSRHHRLVRERDGGNGYAAQSDPRLFFGLGDDARVELLEVRWPDGGLQYLEDFAADRVIPVRQDPGLYAPRPRIEAAPPGGLPRRAPQVASTAEMAPADAERRLAEAEERLRQRPPGFAAASAYRALAAAAGQHDRAIAFFERQIESDGDAAAARVELALAYVDKIPTCGGVAAIVCKGSLAKKSLDHLDAVVAADPEGWLGLYARGLNHLHWPRALRHSDDAARDLGRCVEIQRRADGDPPAYYLRTYVALGDALAKAGDYQAARQAWREGLAAFPAAQELEERLAVRGDSELLAYVEQRRSLEQPIDTDLSFLD